MIEIILVIFPICTAIILLAQLVMLSAIHHNHQELIELLDAALTMVGEALEEK